MMEIKIISEKKTNINPKIIIKSDNNIQKNHKKKEVE